MVDTKWTLKLAEMAQRFPGQEFTLKPYREQLRLAEQAVADAVVAVQKQGEARRAAQAKADAKALADRKAADEKLQQEAG